MPSFGYEIAVILLLVLANGVFAMSEIAVLSSRKVRLLQRAQAGDAGAAVALRLAESPTDFLSTVQVGITLVGTLAGAFGGATLADPLAAWLARFPLLAPYRHLVALALVVAGIAFLSLVLGELAPKRLALFNPETLAAAVARPMRLLSVAATPLVRLLSGSTNLVLRLFRLKPTQDPPVTEEEIKLLLAIGTQAGMFEASEREMVERVFRLADRRVAALMTPRTKIAWLEVGDPPGVMLEKVRTTPFARLVVAEGSLDNWLGFVRVRDVLVHLLGGEPLDLRAWLRQPHLVPEGARAMTLLERFKTSGIHLALVIDEYGGVEGLVTLNDVLEAVVGDISTGGEAAETDAVQREDGSWLVSGTTPIEDFKELLGTVKLPGEDRGEFRTLGGFVMRRLARVPREGDHFHWGGLRFEVVDMDGNLIDKVLVAKTPDEEGPADQ
ncbi:MAG: hemolysin family protein [Acidobacteriota bacterium]